MIRSQTIVFQVPPQSLGGGEKIELYTDFNRRISPQMSSILDCLLVKINCISRDLLPWSPKENHETIARFLKVYYKLLLIPSVIKYAMAAFVLENQS